jgi:NAD+ synthase (glutamine-hydrolysing)
VNLSSVRIALAQINSTVGDVEDNVRRIKSFIEQARAAGADLVVFPELAVPGYPPEDLLLKPSLIAANQEALDDIAPLTGGLTVILGYADADDDLYNAAAILHDGHLASVYHKHYLPNYGVFDEDRYFRPGEDHDIFERNGVVFGVSVCEDIWYPTGPPAAQAQAGAHLLINISASPYHADKSASRERMLATRAADSVAIVVFCNLVGGQDELIFDGASVIVDERGEVIARGPQFKEHLLVVDLDVTNVFRQRLHDPRRRKMPLPSAIIGAQSQITRISLPAEPTGKQYHPLRHFPITERLPRVEEIYRALVLGTRDYTHKNGFEKAVIGLSGGVDSALVACIAADALGAENVTGVSMPSRYSAEISGTDAAQLADNLGINFMVIPIEKPFQAYLDTLAEPFAGQEAGVAEENLQARTRGNLLMALSNKFGWLVLTTGNKSEMSVGYATLYGDMAGGFAVIKDVPKQLVYELAHWRNEQAEIAAIPERVLTRAPTAELRYDQKDSDTLPPYEVLDPILQAYVEEDRALADIVAMGYDETLVRRVIHMVDRNEYKRRQAPPGIKITPRAFGKDRRLPITNRFHPQ